MRKEVYQVQSEVLEKNLQVNVYGHFGINFLLFPITDDDPTEWEHVGLIKALTPLIEKGHIKLFSVETNNLDSWLNNSIPHKERSDNHYKFNAALINDIVQFIYNDNGSAVPIVTAGGGIGAFHAVNTYFRRPDIFIGAIGANGFYDIRWLSGSFYDGNCYFNSPLHYLPNLTEDYWLSFLRSQNNVFLLAEEGNWDMINQCNRLGDILNNKNIKHTIDVVNRQDFPNENINKVMIEKIIKFKF